MMINMSVEELEKIVDSLESKKKKLLDDIIMLDLMMIDKEKKVSEMWEIRNEVKKKVGILKGYEMIIDGRCKEYCELWRCGRNE